jgi:hypothetical protein
VVAVDEGIQICPPLPLDTLFPDLVERVLQRYGLSPDFAIARNGPDFPGVEVSALSCTTLKNLRNRDIRLSFFSTSDVVTLLDFCFRCCFAAHTTRENTLEFRKSLPTLLKWRCLEFGVLACSRVFLLLI